MKEDWSDAPAATLQPKHQTDAAETRGTSAVSRQPFTPVEAGPYPA